MKNSRGLVVIAVATVAMLGAGCAKKKVAAITPNTPPQQTASAPSTPAADGSRSRHDSHTGRQRLPLPGRTCRTLPRALASINCWRRLKMRISTTISTRCGRMPSRPCSPIRAELRDILKDYPDYKLTIEGHADERGSAQYNMALGEARAEAAKNYLVQVGISGQQLGVVSYGKEKPDLPGSDRSVLPEESPHSHRGSRASRANFGSAIGQMV